MLYNTAECFLTPSQIINPCLNIVARANQDRVDGYSAAMVIVTL